MNSATPDVSGFRKYASSVAPSSVSDRPKTMPADGGSRKSAIGRIRVRRIRRSVSRSHAWLSAEAPPATRNVPSNVCRNCDNVDSGPDPSE